jgi:hypothetical protein
MRYHISHPLRTSIDADTIDEIVLAVNADPSLPPGQYALESRDGPNGSLVRRGDVIKQKNGLSCFLEDRPITQ